ncbi:MAG: metallophosphoesterase [Coprobacillaceae bacterium]
MGIVMILGIAGIIGGIAYVSYFCMRFIKLFTKIELTTSKKTLIVILIIFLSSLAVNMFTLYAVVYFHLLIISFLLEILYYFLKKYKYIKYMIPTGLAAIIITGGFFAYGHYNINHLVKTSYSYESDKIDSLRILQITDLHMSRSVSVERLEEYVERMSAEKPDIVFLTGDLFEELTTLEDMEAASKLLGSIDNELGIYFVFGNHDPQPYTDSPVFTSDDIRRNLTDNGIIVLEDEVTTVDNLTIVGRIDGGFSNARIPRISSEELLKDVDQDSYIIVLDHRPLDLEENASLGVDLQLSGHTHGGQLFPMRIVQNIFSDELVYGERAIDDFHAITSSGISGVGYPIKTGAPSEYVIVDIK